MQFSQALHYTPPFQAGFIHGSGKCSFMLFVSILVIARPRSVHDESHTRLTSECDVI